MKPLSFNVLSKISDLIEKHFGSVALKFLGMIPEATKNKRLTFSVEPNSIASLFVEALGAEKPTEAEEDTLKSLLVIADSYVDALKDKTKAKTMQEIASYTSDMSRQNKPINMRKIGNIFEDNIEKAKKHFEIIAGQESNKTVNTGMAMQISRVAANVDDEDPTVAFKVVVDEVTGPYEFILHLLPDKITPRVWKMSEVTSAYYKPGDQYPSLSGLHVNCFTESQRIYTDEGIFTFKELYESQKSPIVMVDGRIINKKIPANQLGVEIPGLARLDPHNRHSARFLPATPVYSTGKQEVLKITMKSGHQIEVTENHDMWACIGNTKWGKKPAKSLVVGDKIPLSAYSECFGQDNFPELAELMGNYLGDGGFDAKTNVCTWNFFGDDINYAKKLISIRNKIDKSNGNVHDPIVLKIMPPDNKHNVERASFSSYYVGELAANDFGFSKKPRRVPERLFKANKETVSAFLRGLYAADGHSEYNNIVIAQNDYEFLQQIQLLISMFGFVSRIQNHDKAMDKIITYADGREFLTHRKQCWRLMMGGADQMKRFIEEIGFGVESKQLRAVKNLKLQTQGKKISNWIVSKIDKIEKIGIKDTYCLTEPMTNTVTVNGIITGQCRCRIFYVPKGYGFDKDGKIKFISMEYDEFKTQREKYGLPNVPTKISRTKPQK